MQPSAPDQKWQVQKHFRGDFYLGTEWTTPSKPNIIYFFVFTSKCIFCTQYKLNFTIMSDIATRVKKIIVDKLGVDEAEVTLKLLLLTTWAQTAWTPLNLS